MRTTKCSAARLKSEGPLQAGQTAEEMTGWHNLKPVEDPPYGVRGAP
jgi:hypothetical protein